MPKGMQSNIISSSLTFFCQCRMTGSGPPVLGSVGQCILPQGKARGWGASVPHWIFFWWGWSSQRRRLGRCLRCHYSWKKLWWTGWGTRRSSTLGFGWSLLGSSQTWRTGRGLGKAFSGGPPSDVPGKSGGSRRVGRVMEGGGWWVGWGCGGRMWGGGRMTGIAFQEHPERLRLRPVAAVVLRS